MNEEDLIELSVITGWAGEPITDVIVYPSSEYFTFKGWNKEVPNAFPDESMQFYPIIGNNSSITYKAYPGMFPNIEQTDIVYIGEIGMPFSETPPTPIRTGYTFDRWSSETPSVFPEHNIEIQSLWNPGSYYITFDYDGGIADDEVSSISSVLYDEPYPIAPNPTKTFTVDFITAIDGMEIAQTSSFDCEFTGYWSLKNSSGTQYYSNSRFPLLSAFTVGDDLALYAGWINHSAPSSGNFNDISCEGYNFLGWYESRESTTRIYNYSPLTSNKTLFAKWTPKTYTIYFDYNYGKTGNVSASTSSVTYDSIAPNAPNVTTPPQYKIFFVSAATGSTVAQTKYFDRPFTGFFSDHAGGYGTGTQYYNADRSKTSEISPYTIASSITCYAGWGKAGSSGNLTALYAPTRSGYRFDGWCDDTNRTHVITGFSEINEHKTVYAKWEITATSWTISGSTFENNHYKKIAEYGTTSSKTWTWTTTIQTSELTGVPDGFKLSEIKVWLYLQSDNNKSTSNTGYFMDGRTKRSQSISSGKADQVVSEVKTISGITGTYTKNNSIQVKFDFYLYSSGGHEADFAASVQSLKFVSS